TIGVVGAVGSAGGVVGFAPCVWLGLVVGVGLCAVADGFCVALAEGVACCAETAAARVRTKAVAAKVNVALFFMGFSCWGKRFRSTTLDAIPAVAVQHLRVIRPVESCFRPP